MSAPEINSQRPQTRRATSLAKTLAGFDLGSMRAEIAALRQTMRNLGWPEPHANADADAALCRALTECKAVLRQAGYGPTDDDPALASSRTGGQQT